MQLVDRLVMLVLSPISITLASKYIYRRTFHKKLNLKQPKTFNEKLMWLKLKKYTDSELVTQCVDKYRVREYVIAMGFEDILTPLIGVWNSVEEIAFDMLPDKFVIKCNHGCGYNIICTNKNTLDTEQIKKTLNKWIREDFWKRFAESNYKRVPKKILCETYIENGEKLLPLDYKFYCFYGKAMYVMVCCGRENGRPNYYFFNRDWQLMRINPDSIAATEDLGLPRPKRLSEMFEYADKLAAPFPFVRVDLYEANNNIRFGELTFTPAAALDTNRSPQADALFSSLLPLPE